MKKLYEPKEGKVPAIETSHFERNGYTRPINLTLRGLVLTKIGLILTPHLAITTSSKVDRKQRSLMKKQVSKCTSNWRKKTIFHFVFKKSIRVGKEMATFVRTQWLGHIQSMQN